jgi:sugar-phosphatase
MLILDFDGVLVDSEPVNFASWNETFDELLGIRIEDDHRQLVGLSLDDVFRLWRSPDLDDVMKARLLARKTELFFSIGAGRLAPMPGSVELIRRAQAEGWYVALASRARRRRLFRTLDVMGMPALFDVILGGEACIQPETDRKDHAKAARMFGIDPLACVVVEDSESGVRDALAAGIGRVIGLTTSLDARALRAAGAHEVVDDLGAVDLNSDSV